jgi:hypothetical protein
MINASEAQPFIPVFCDAAWELCRRGIFRPGRRKPVTTSIGERPLGYGFAITALGRAWLEQVDNVLFIPTEPSRFAQFMDKFRAKLGEGFLQRAQEATRCHSSLAYLACCTMCGAAAESILLRIAIAKTGDEQDILKKYRAAGGRKKVEYIIVGCLRQHLSSQFKSLIDLLSYWRDEASHGGVSDISEIEAYQALNRLLRLALFVDDHWDELVGQGNAEGTASGSE